MYSLASSSLAHGIAKTCSSGQTSKCGCAPIPQETPNGDFQWGGCGDDIRFGVGFSKVFMESGEIGRKRRAINVHNAAVGRKVSGGGGCFGGGVVLMIMWLRWWWCDSCKRVEVLVVVVLVEVVVINVVWW